jgi:hypothetical protein
MVEDFTYLSFKWSSTGGGDSDLGKGKGSEAFEKSFRGEPVWLGGVFGGL